ncbi:VWA domain-containing protein [Burkholderia aenigmatica]|uniref:vWA domain-containing protein n=1 Tax=Burkholderia cepacia complex TaxID=87882 RepID=UPI001C246981|nr:MULTISPECIES: VWA domain-containing protein [Burkholderia cepacia complex]MBU9445235.1 VWA domain-containing protein [Burkholderia multivorans]MCA8222093.1 VWA domain-containing protein [Burkholderia multivorans]UKD17547.1 VWA domain-containing protein [Burkholderia aenigmatica]
MSDAHLEEGSLPRLIRFTETLRESGLRIGMLRIEGFLAGITTLGRASLYNVHLVGRATLCASPEDYEIFDRCFEQFFSDAADTPAEPTAAPTLRFHRFAAVGEAHAADPDGTEETRDLAVASADEVLRQRDFAAMTDAERDEILKLIAHLKVSAPMRRSLRYRPARRGAIAVKQTIRASLAAGGDAVEARYRKVRQRVRKCVFLLDVSGSMKPYSDALLRFALAAQLSNLRSTHVFAAGTRLTYLSSRNLGVAPEHAVESASRAIPDWHGGTRLGEQLRDFIDRWGQRGMARGAVVVIASDGFEQGDTILLEEQIGRLHRLAYRVIWCNPHKSTPGYEPLANGMRAALPHVDDFMPGRNVDELAELAKRIADCGSRR